MPYKDEIIAVSPIVINGDYSKSYENNFGLASKDGKR